MIQLRPFNQAQGGTTPNMCLANVTKGYGIPNRYASAWEAWEHTQQHGDEPPAGLDIPLYYSYYVALDDDKVPQNYGHINVRLANGTVWSDGKIYSSIQAYTGSPGRPKYVGWGESVNDVKVIEGEDMKLNAEQVNKLSVLASFQQSKDNPGVLGNEGLDLDTALDNFLSYPTTIAYREAALAYQKGQVAPTTVVINGKNYVPEKGK